MKNTKQQYYQIKQKERNTNNKIKRYDKFTCPPDKFREKHVETFIKTYTRFFESWSPMEPSDCEWTARVYWWTIGKTVWSKTVST